MTYTAVDPSLFDTGDPGRSIDGKQMLTNQADFNARLIAVEDPSIRIASHFTELFRDVLTIAADSTEGEHMPWRFQAEGANSRIQQGAHPGTDNHYIILNQSAGGANHGQSLMGKVGFYFDNRVKPITCTIRFKINDTAVATGWDEFFVGLGGMDAGGFWAPHTTGEPENGIYLMRNNDTDWHVRARRASVDSDDPAWTHGLDDSWVELIITWVSASSTATVTVNGTTRATFTDADNIPNDRTLYPFAQAKGANAAAEYMYIDRISCSAGGAVVDMA